MSSFIKKYTELFRRLLPKGKLWDDIACDPLFDGVVGEFSRVEERANDLLNVEMDPCSASEMLTDWESMVGIPDECTPLDQTDEERRAAVKERLARIGSLSASFYEQIGSLLGFDITVENCDEFLVGYGTVGDALCNSHRIPDVFTVGDHTVGQQLAVFGWRYYFSVEVPISESSFFRVGENTVGDRLREFGNENVQCSIEKLKPAHTGAFFKFTE